MGLVDMKNELDNIKLTSKQIEEQISGYSLSFLPIRRHDIEWGMKFPMFIPAFYKYITEQGIIPQQVEFWEQYDDDNKSDPIIQQLNLEQREALKARVFRTYPSLVRDIHFALLLRESGEFDEVIYNQDLDITQGIDLVVIHIENIYVVNLFIDTQRAHEGRYKKQFRHEKLKVTKNIELPVDFKGSKECGSFFLYSTRELKMLQEMILDYEMHS